MTVPIQPYNKNAKCIKCGSDLVTKEYVVTYDLLVRKCSECGFFWNEFPLDRLPPRDTSRPNPIE